MAGKVIGIIAAWIAAIVASAAWMLFSVMPCLMAFDSPQSQSDPFLPWIMGGIFFGPPVVAILLAVAATIGLSK